jgi:5-(carboxyamino)imidazole ribonucleotide mutase
MEDKPVSIIMGSDSDLKIMSEAAKVLEELGIGYDIVIASAHRTPDIVEEYVKNANKKGVEVIIAGAGGAAHLPGVIASMFYGPVIGVPIGTTSLSGLDSLLSIVQMPSGIPVATVSINGSKNAALLAAQILSVKYPDILEKLKSYRRKMREGVIKKSEKLQKIGYKNYLREMSK